MKRVFKRVEDLEEAAMWRPLTGMAGKKAIQRAAVLMQSAERFRDAMHLATNRWPNSCEHNLSWCAQNRIAWLGQAGCFVGVQSPEACTRLAWHTLTPTEHDQANATANVVLHEWINIITGREDAQEAFRF